MRKEIRYGLVFLAAYIILSRSMVLPSILLGILIGLSLIFLVIGLVPIKAYNFIRTKKGKIRQVIENKIINKKQ